MCVFSYSMYLVSCCCDLDFYPMTLTYELDLDILKMYLHTTNEPFGLRLSKVELEQDRRTDRQTDVTETEHLTTTAFTCDNDVCSSLQSYTV